MKIPDHTTTCNKELHVYRTKQLRQQRGEICSIHTYAQIGTRIPTKTYICLEICTVPNVHNFQSGILQKNTCTRASPLQLAGDIHSSYTHLAHTCSDKLILVFPAAKPVPIFGTTETHMEKTYSKVYIAYMHVLLSAETFGYFHSFGTDTYSNKRVYRVRDMHQFVQPCMYFMHIYTPGRLIRNASGGYFG
jgi:hypothetical protein